LGAAFRGFFANRDKAIANLVAVGNQFKSPEHIDLGEATCPSRRILKEFPDYAKTTLGPLLTLEIGLDRLRAA
jgi:hypothetical protein